MSLRISLPLEEATLADLESAVAAARAAGMGNRATIEVDAETTTLTITAGADSALTPDLDAWVRTSTGSRAGHENGVAGIGEQAVRSVIDILTGRMEPPRPS